MKFSLAVSIFLTINANAFQETVRRRHLHRQQARFRAVAFEPPSIDNKPLTLKENVEVNSGKASVDFTGVAFSVSPFFDVEDIEPTTLSYMPRTIDGEKRLI